MLQEDLDLDILIMDIASLLCPLILFLVHTTEGRSLKFYSSFKFGDVVFGIEDNIQDFVTLQEDPKSNLPNSFTICTSLSLHFLATCGNHFINMQKRDGTNWFTLFLATARRNYDTKSEAMRIWYKDPITGTDVYSQTLASWSLFHVVSDDPGAGEDEMETFRDTNIPIVPDSWYHVCMGLDTVSGHVRIVVNGKVLVNEPKDYFRDFSNHFLQF